MHAASRARLAACLVWCSACGEKTAALAVELPIDDALGRAMAQSVQLAISDQDGTACDGKWLVTFHESNHSGADGGFDTNLVATNAQALGDDESVVAVVGTLNSGAAMVAIPILNEAGLVMVSPSNTMPGLTQEIGADEGEPDTFYPSGERNFARVVGPDHLGGQVAIRWAAELGATSVSIIDDGEDYGVALAQSLELAAADAGIEVEARRSVNDETNFDFMAAGIVGDTPDLVYFAGFRGDLAALLFAELDNFSYTGMLMGSDALYSPDFLEEAGAAAEGMYVATAAMPPDQLTSDEGAAWTTAYESAWGEPPDVYAAEAYVAAQVILAAFDAVCEDHDPLTDRDAVRSAVMATDGVSTLLGPVTFDENGDIENPRFAGLQAVDGAFAFSGMIEL